MKDLPVHPVVCRPLKHIRRPCDPPHTVSGEEGRGVWQGGEPEMSVLTPPVLQPSMAASFSSSSSLNAWGGGPV
jgi:hypothetical protein